jgi:hypothetical protein
MPAKVVSVKLIHCLCVGAQPVHIQVVELGQPVVASIASMQYLAIVHLFPYVSNTLAFLL